MRVIAGKYRSRLLAEFEGKDIRPTSDRVKESLFGILTPRLYKSRVLDLFCGSGNLGIEALSRGAESVVFNDASKASLEVLKKNLKSLKIEGQKILNCDYMTALGMAEGKFDIIFLDPPYKEEFAPSALKKIAERELLSDDGVIVYERDSEIQTQVAGLKKTDVRKYGKTVLTFFQKEEV